MRIAAWVVGLALVAGTAAGGEASTPKKPDASPLKPFDFKGFVAGVDLTPEQASTCRHKEMGSAICGDIDDDKVAGVRVYSSLIATANNKLSYVHIAADPLFFEVLTNAFTAKYGKPCKSVLEKWVSQLGTSRQNPSMTWCFTSGKLVAKMYGVVADVSDIDYIDANKAAVSKPSPQIDF